MAVLRWSAPTRDDDLDWADLLAAIEAVDGRGETYELDDLADEWASVWSHPDTDAVFVWDGPQLVAFGWLKTQVGTTKGHRIACWGGVRPSHRRRGIGSELLAWQLQRASEITAALDPALPADILIDVADHQADLIRLATRLGFEPIRRFLELARPTGVPVEPVEPVFGLELVPWSEKLDEATRAAHQHSFVDHWGSEPRSIEEWRQWHTGHRGFRPELSVLAVDPARGVVAGFVLCATYPQDWATGPVEAWVNSVGTRREWRGMGVARWALSDVLSRIATSGTGFERSMLGVDAENPTGALRVYRRLGFVDERVTLTMGRAPLPR